ncbi:RNA-binding ASCH domain protein [Euphorbia peplus]|nr:RNA-binding ASCH domain protein [Euphorbia peplus]
MELLEKRIEKLMKFTVHSHINQTLEFNLSLSKDFCTNLLSEDDANDNVLAPASSHTGGSFDGVPYRPLFKRLASALYKSILSRSFVKTYDAVEFIREDVSVRLKEDQWQTLVLENGTRIVEMLKTIVYELHVQEPFFSLLKDGLKTVEGRCAGGKHSRIELGALVLLNKCVVLEVKDVHRYPSFMEMLEAESLLKVLPGVKTIEEGVKIYRQFYTEEQEMSNGVIAICVSTVSPQPYLYMANILSGLGYGGVQSLLGIAHTFGTVFDALPPPRSALLSSFALTYKPKVKGSVLTHGARALAKHAERCGNKYWGTLNGNDDTKNRLAMNVINCLVASCRWSNVHIVPPHGAVYEIRTVDGYGARWSSDGTKFIGFLEPYTEVGYSKGWKH